MGQEEDCAARPFLCAANSIGQPLAPKQKLWGAAETAECCQQQLQCHQWLFPSSLHRSKILWNGEQTRLSWSYKLFRCFCDVVFLPVEICELLALRNEYTLRAGSLWKDFPFTWGGGGMSFFLLFLFCMLISFLIISPCLPLLMLTCMFIQNIGYTNTCTDWPLNTVVTQYEYLCPFIFVLL